MWAWIGDGARTLFWTDRWLEGCRIRDKYPSLVAAVRPRVVNKRSVHEGLQGARLSDVGPDLGEVALAEFLALWTRIQRFQLVDNREDALLWNCPGLEDQGTRQVSILRLVGGEGSLLDGGSATEEGAHSPFLGSALFSGAGDPVTPPAGLCRGETGLGGGPCGVGLSRLEA
ncbi:hypothetical protein BRADI_3g38003v3 [Brachypodium distachyon]|uniref:Reverse transcriptase zinc-binding domain-containing protein n=1 Tax=Brachypodium distachyon TaxID=15368 RepID=A0A2K2D1V5_BRADI|nr:hypothetical protein BRADI_3g38003v3 [Brachypodium distachyon]